MSEMAFILEYVAQSKAIHVLKTVEYPLILLQLSREREREREREFNTLFRGWFKGLLLLLFILIIIIIYLQYIRKNRHSC